MVKASEFKISSECLNPRFAMILQNHLNNLDCNVILDEKIIQIFHFLNGFPSVFRHEASIPNGNSRLDEFRKTPLSRLTFDRNGLKNHIFSEEIFEIPTNYGRCDGSPIVYFGVFRPEIYTRYK